MSRTKNFNLTGRAASIEKAEQREMIYEAQEARRAERLASLLAEEEELILKCIAIEGKEKFFSWYGNDANVPAYGSTTSRIEQVKNRLSQLDQRDRLSDAQESARIQNWMSEHWEEIPEVEF